MNQITQTIEKFYEPLNNYTEKGENTRYKSWEWCHSAFMKHKDEYQKPSTTKERKDEIVDILALHLTVYLASWGMYRGSSFLLRKRDYKTHKTVIEEVLQQKYNLLWDFDPIGKPKKVDTAANALFNKEDGLFYFIQEKGYAGETATDTLVTKILLGTFACIPAYDRNFKKGISVSDNDMIQAAGINSFLKLCDFADKQKSQLRSMEYKYKDFNQLYPIMKLLDMYFWQLGADNNGDE